VSGVFSINSKMGKRLLELCPWLVVRGGLTFHFQHLLEWYTHMQIVMCPLRREDGSFVHIYNILIFSYHVPF
jgi:hypothetical protein